MLKKKRKAVLRLMALLCAVTIFGCGCASKTVTGDVTGEKAGRAGEITMSSESETYQVTTGINAQTSLYETPVPDETSAAQQSGDTYTGRAPLPEVSLEAQDAQNASGLSTKKICHSHGPASGGKAHYTVVNFQKSFDKYGAFTLDTVSTEKVLYLTFDCGWEYNNLTSEVLDVLKEKDVTAAFFCTLTHIKQETDLIARMINEGHIVGNHSATHPSFASIDRTKMAQELESVENYLRTEFGYSSKYFRFPAGEYNESALELVNSLGFTSVFWSLAYDDWDVKTVRGAAYTVDVVMKRMHPGAVILLHSVSQDNAEALGEIIDKARAEGYVFRSLDEYRT